MIWGSIAMSIQMILIAFFSCKFWQISFKIEHTNTTNDPKKYDYMLNVMLIVVVLLNAVSPWLFFYVLGEYFYGDKDGR